jgi:hypothetical protein
MTTNLWTVGQGLITRRLVPKTAAPEGGLLGAWRQARGESPGGGGGSSGDGAKRKPPAPKPAAPQAAKPKPPAQRPVRRKKKKARR